MIARVEMNGKKVLAVTLPEGGSMSDVRKLRSALMDVMETCLSSDESKDNTASISLWFLLRMIHELEDCIEKDDGMAD